MDLPFGNSVFEGTILMRRMMKERDEREAIVFFFKDYQTKTP